MLTYQDLPPILTSLSADAPPMKARAPELCVLNAPLSDALGLDVAALRRGGRLFAGVLPEGHPTPRAFAYSGHQFGGFSPLLGDGRATLLGEIADPSGTRWQVQLKGCGRTPFSRPGSDGKAWLGPVLREYVLSEAMHALGIPTTRALAAATTGEPVYRETTYPGAMLTRVSRGLLRVGTFEFIYSRKDVGALQALVDHALSRHYPEVEPGPSPALTLLECVAARQADLVSRWMAVGFIHGVMNTDNCSIAGETIDYGPCAFLDAYHAEQVFSSIDHMGRYAYGNQSRIIVWNLSVFAQSLVPLLPGIEEAQALLDGFEPRFEAIHTVRARTKLGLATSEAGDRDLYDGFLALLQREEADFTRSFRALSKLTSAAGPGDAELKSELKGTPALDGWLTRWRARLEREGSVDAERTAAMASVNPAVIPRNHRIEEMIDAAIAGDLAPMERLLVALATPFALAPEYADLAEAPKPSERVLQTFCGT